MLAAAAPLIGAGISGAFNMAAADKAADEAAKTREAQIDLWNRNNAAQKEFAQWGLTWKIEDAMRNADRVHPIYSLGGGGASFSPSTPAFQSDTSGANALAATGQDISRAISATASASQREDAFSVASRKLLLEKGTLENELLRTQIASMNGRLRQNANPPFPAVGDASSYLVPGQSSSGLIKNKPLEVTPGVATQPQSEGGAITDVGYARTSTGWAPVPSKDVKERIEDNLIQEVMHAFRNNVLPTVGLNKSPPPFEAPKGKEWHFNPLRQEYQLFDADSTWARINRPMNQYKRHRWFY